LGLHVLAVRVGLEERRQPPKALKAEQEAVQRHLTAVIAEFQRNLLNALSDAHFPDADRPAYTSRSMFGRTKQRKVDLRYEVYRDTVSVRSPTGDKRGPYSDEWRPVFLAVAGQPVNQRGEPEAAHDSLKGVLGLHSIAVGAGIDLAIPNELRSL
jgi:hypothetical protein